MDRLHLHRVGGSLYRPGAAVVDRVGGGLRGYGVGHRWFPIHKALDCTHNVKQKEAWN